MPPIFARSGVDLKMVSPHAYTHPGNLVRVLQIQANGFVTWDHPYDTCDGLASDDPDFAEVICQGQADLAFTDGGSAERVRVHFVSPNFFSSLGVRPWLGRVLTSDDERTAANNAVLSFDFWRRRFQSNPRILGRSIVLGGHPFT